MRIPLPPVSDRGIEGPIATNVKYLNEYFGPFEKEEFEEYFSRFEWFKGALPHTKVILNVGCSWGRETFALMWFLRATQAVGIDVCVGRIEYALRKANMSFEVLARMVPNLLGSSYGLGLSDEYIERLRVWWKAEVPCSVRNAVENDIVPEFVVGDISKRESINRPDHYFDLVYCRYVLDKIMDEGGSDKVILAIQNIASVTKPRTGRVIVVEPTYKEDRCYDFEPFFSEAGMRFEETRDKNDLGKLRWPETESKGYIYVVADEALVSESDAA